MRPSLLAYLLLLFLLISDAEGIRLEKGFISVGRHQKIHEKNPMIKTSNDGLGEVILCKDGHCSGNDRKLLTKNTSPFTTTTTSKNVVKNGGNKVDPASKGKSSNRLGGEEENFSVNSSPVLGQREAAPEHYPDIIDIAGMDYSPAKRKPPIHN